ncbi:MAG: hypothetical protein ABI619_12300, partial [Betaproteobacteria bacterium]
MSTRNTPANPLPVTSPRDNWEGDLAQSPAMHAIQEAVHRVEAETSASLAAQNRVQREVRSRVAAEERARLEADAARLTEQRARADEEAAQSALALIDTERLALAAAEQRKRHNEAAIEEARKREESES